jgi:hypothetical protein
MMGGNTIYYVLLGVLALLVLGGGLIKKFAGKADVDLSDEQLDIVAAAVADALSQVEKANESLVASGEEEMGREEKVKVATKLASELAVAAGVSKVKVELLLKLLNTALDKDN